MKTYLVGGAVRDQLLGRPETDRDWLVLGTSEEELLGRGFKRVGRSFGVFLHPETGEEYALPRGADDTVEADLAARDLSINAMARDESGALLDPFGGQRDLDARTLRHVGESFADDPVRVLRVARIAAELSDYGFTVAPETKALMSSLVAASALSAISPERVWAELEKLLSSQAPAVGLRILTGCGATLAVLTDWTCSGGQVASNLDFRLAEEALTRAARAQAPVRVRLAAYLLGLRGPKRASLDLRAFVHQCCVPNEASRLVAWTQAFGGLVASLPVAESSDLLDMLSRVLRRGRPEDLADLVAVERFVTLAQGDEFGLKLPDWSFSE